MYLVGFSGPPRSGKDSIAARLAVIIENATEQWPQVLSLSMPMRKAVYAMAGMEYSLNHYEEWKDKPLAQFNGKSIRHEMIELSERHVKPRLGAGFWGEAVTNQIWIGTKVVIVTDMGFNAELKVFDEACGVGNCVWVQVERPGTDWLLDSRSYIGDPAISHVTQLWNGGTIEEAATRLYERLVTQFGWKLGRGA